MEAGRHGDATRMIRDRIIICIASRWDYDPTSKHHVMRILARDNAIVWVSYHGTRRPAASSSDLGDVAAAAKRVVRGVRRVEDMPNMVQFTPLVIPGARDPRVRSLSQRLLAVQIRRAVRAVRRDPRQPVQLWTYAPDVEHLAGRFGEECVVYCCVDEFREFAGVDRELIAAAEHRLIERSDVVFTTSEPLYESRRLLHENTHLLRHGVDGAHFARALEEDLPIPDSLAGVKRPIAGFFGLIHHWVDSALIAAVARRCPAVSFVLIGEVRTEVRPLAELPNVHLLGRRDYAELPAYCRAFDVGLLPFVRNRMTRHVNPIKLREYLAAGLPVISTRLPEAERYWPDVTIADDAEAFATACEAAIARSDAVERRRRSELVADETWESVVERASRIVVQSLRPRPVGSRAVALAH